MASAPQVTPPGARGRKCATLSVFVMRTTIRLVAGFALAAVLLAVLVEIMLVVYRDGLAFHQGNCSDGLFEVMEMSAGRVKQAAHNLSALSGTRAYEPYPPRQARSARLSLEAPRNLMIDGEIFPNVVSLDIRILPSALECNGPRSE